MNHRRPFCMGAVMLACMLMSASTRAQEPKIYLDLDAVTAEPGQQIAVSVFIENLPDSIQAYQMNLSMSRPDIAAFMPVIDQAGTLTEDWNGGITLINDHYGRITSSAGFPPSWAPIPPNTSGTLVKFVVELYCNIPDTVQDRTLDIYISPVNTVFANARGEVVEPLDLTQGSVTAGLRCPYQGDIEPDGFITSIDLAAIISALFEGGPNPQDVCCPTYRFDFDCDGFVTALDLSVIIDHLFAGGHGPCIP